MRTNKEEPLPDSASGGIDYVYEKRGLFDPSLWIERFERVLICEWDAFESRMGRTTADALAGGAGVNMHVIAAF
jgi:hypothetical protein